MADAWHPKEGGPWPVLLQRLPYGRSVASTPTLPHPSWFAARGYLVVVQDTRGRGESSGDFEPFLHLADDGVAAVEWAAELPHSNGDVGLYGFSYQGLLQLYTAARRPPSLRAIAPMMCAPDPYEGWTYEGGALRWPFVCFWAAQLAGQSLQEGPQPFDTTVVPASSALGDAPPTWFTQWLSHPDGDDDFWETRRPDLSAIDVPAFVVAGWFDDFSSASIRVAQALGAELHIGPWAHMPWGSRAGGVELGPLASPSPTYEALVSFFDRVLKGSADRPERSVRYYTQGRGWAGTDIWPPATTNEVLHASSGGNANSRHGDGLLSVQSPSQGLSDVIVVEPHVPYPGEETPLSDEGPAEDRRDVCCYTTEPLASDQVLTGSVLVEVSTRSDRPSHDVVVSLVIVEEGEPPRRLATGIRRFESAALHTTREAVVELRPISWTIPRGSRLRIDVSGGRFPAFDRNPHTGDPIPTNVPASEMKVATTEILSVEVHLPFETE